MIFFDNITVRFDNKILFENFSLHIEKREKVWIKAPSGSGKTTLFRLISGFVHPQMGDVFVFGEKLAAKNAAKIRSQLSYAGQEAALPNRPVHEIFREIYAFEANKALSYNENTFKDYAELLKLDTDVYQKNFGALSAGEKQRVCFIIALMLDKPLFLLDEITSNLDAKTKSACADLIQALDKTVLLISHDSVFENYDLREVLL